MITHHCDLLITAALFLPRFDKRTVMEIDIQVIIIAADDIHLEHLLSKKSEQRFLKSLQRLALAALLHKILPLILSASPDRIRCKILCSESVLLRFIAEQIHPQRSVLKLFPDPDNKRVLYLSFVNYPAHFCAPFSGFAAGSPGIP